MTKAIDLGVARKVLETVDAGLSHGLGSPEPGKFCVEAAVCYALGLPHGDDPGCVSYAVRSLKIRLNDSNWSSNEARGKGLRRLALAQLGSKDVIDDKEFTRRVIELAIRKSVPAALRAAASVHKDPKHQALNAAAKKCESEANRASALEARSVARAARDAADAAAAAAAAAAYAAAAAAAYAAAAAAAAAAKKKARDTSLAGFAEDVVQILIDMKAPGCEWLVLTEAA